MRQRYLNVLAEIRKLGTWYNRSGAERSRKSCEQKTTQLKSIIKMNVSIHCDDEWGLWSDVDSERFQCSGRGRLKASCLQRDRLYRISEQGTGLGDYFLSAYKSSVVARVGSCKTWEVTLQFRKRRTGNRNIAREWEASETERYTERKKINDVEEGREAERQGLRRRG